MSEKILKYNEFEVNESLPRQSTVNQLKKLRKLTKGTDIQDKIKSSNLANEIGTKNMVDDGIESYEHYIKSNRKKRKVNKLNESKKKVKLKDKNPVFDYGCVLFLLKIKEWKSIIGKIDEDDVYLVEDDDSYGIETKPHLTLLYGLHEEVTKSDVKSVVDKFKDEDIIIEVDGISIFENKDFDVVKFDVKKTPILNKMNKELKKFPFTSDFPDYHPHITICYVKKGKGKKYIDENYELEFKATKLEYSRVNDKNYYFKF